jgi:hypothetical protein
LQAIKSCINNGGSVPTEYMDYLLIKELYHCKPTDLDNENEDILRLHFEIMMLERKKDFLDTKRRNQKL